MMEKLLIIVQLLKTNEQINKYDERDIDGYKIIKPTKKIFDVGFTKLADKPFTSLFKMLGVVLV